MSLKSLLKRLTPPILLDAYSAISVGKKNGQPEWEYVPQGWRVRDPNVKGWHVSAVVETYLRQWPDYVKALRGPAAIRGYYGGSPSEPVSYVAHNIFMTFAYVVALAASKKDRLSILDWGGGLGHYYEFSKALLPGVEIEYHCRELPMVCEAGRKLLPEVKFSDDDSCLEQKYDLVFASSALQYDEAWQETLRKMASAAAEYLYVTRLPVVEHVPSFVVVQRPYGHGYQTEYLGWFFNREDFLKGLEDVGMTFVREFYVEPLPQVANAPAPADHRGFLARKRL
jgi:putative methyltransferase (TIGR04325 family)